MSDFMDISPVKITSFLNKWDFYFFTNVGSDWQLFGHNYFGQRGDKPVPYLKSVLDLDTPNDSYYDYLNHSVFIGTLTSPGLKPGEEP